MLYSLPDKQRSPEFLQGYLVPLQANKEVEGVEVSALKAKLIWNGDIPWVVKNAKKRNLRFYGLVLWWVGIGMIIGRKKESK